MKHRNFIAPLLIAGMGFWAGFAQAETKIGSLLELVPADATAVIQVKNAAELPGRIEASSMGKVWKDEKVREFFKPLVDKITEGLNEGEQGKAAQEALGKAKAIFASFNGEVVASVGAVDWREVVLKGKSGEEPNPEEVLKLIPNLVIIGKVSEGKFSQAVADLVAFGKERVKEGAPGTIETASEKIEDVDATIIKAVKKDDGKELEVAGYAEVNGYGVLAIPRRALEDTIKALKSGPKGDSIQSGVLSKMRERAKDSDFLAHINLRGVLKPLLDAVEKEAPPLPEQAQQMGLSVAGIRKALGLDEIQGLSVAATLEPGAETSDMAFHFSKQAGLLKLLAFKNGELPEANFIPQKVGTAGVALFSVGSIWTTVQQIIKDVSPNVSMMVNQQVGVLEQQFGVNLEKDIFGSFDDRLVSVSSVPDAKAAKGGNPMEVFGLAQQDQVYMIGLKDSQAFEVALDKLITNMGVQVEKGEFSGRPLHKIKMPGADNPEAARAMPKVEYSIGKNYFTVSLGKGQLVRRMFAAAKEPGKSLWDQPDVKKAIEKLPKGYCALSYQDVAGQLHAVGQIVGMAMAQAGGDEIPLDFSKLPDAAHLRGLIGNAVSAAYMEKDGLYTRDLQVPSNE